MESHFLSVNWKDFGKGLLLALAVAIVGAVSQMLNEKGFNLSMADLAALGSLAVKVLIGYIAVAFGSNNEGKFGRADN
jgi:hypothetical protein